MARSSRDSSVPGFPAAHEVLLICYRLDLAVWLKRHPDAGERGCPSWSVDDLCAAADIVLASTQWLNDDQIRMCASSLNFLGLEPGNWRVGKILARVGESDARQASRSVHQVVCHTLNHASLSCTDLPLSVKVCRFVLSQVLTRQETN